MKICHVLLSYSCLICVFLIGCTPVGVHPVNSTGDILSSAEFIRSTDSISNDVAASVIGTDFPTTEGLALVLWTKRFLDKKGELPKDAETLTAFAAEQHFCLKYTGLKLTILAPLRLRYDWYSEKDSKYKTRISVFFIKKER
jgi:hypothetical protein